MESSSKINLNRDPDRLIINPTVRVRRKVQTRLLQGGYTHGKARPEQEKVGVNNQGNARPEPANSSQGKAWQGYQRPYTWHGKARQGCCQCSALLGIVIF